jgi:hypothetical protein
MALLSSGRTRWRHSNVIVGGLLAVCLVGLVVVSIYVLPDQLVTHDVGITAVERLKPAELLTAKDNVRRTLLQGIGGLLFLATAFFTWRQLQISRGQLQIGRESQITEQFNKAIDHLGGEQTDVRLGGIYALERIANISDRERGPVVEVLTAYVRGHAPRPDLLDELDPAAIKAPKADVHAAMTVLARRTTGAERGANLDLSRVDLRKVYLASPKVPHAELERVNLQEALLQASNLEAAKLAHADMWMVDLRWSNLQSTDLRNAYLRDADLRDADLRDADLRDAKIQGADMRGVNLELARLEGAQADSRTQWPDGFEATAAGVRLVEC